VGLLLVACTTSTSTPCGQAFCPEGTVCDNGMCRGVTCGNGVVDGAEECDEGGANSDLPGATCRRICTRHSDRLMASSEGFCFLSRVAGNFDQQAAKVDVRVMNDGDWTLDDASPAYDVGASARCVTWSEIGATLEAELSLPFENQAAGEASASKAMWDERSFCYVSGLQGTLRGRGESVDIEPHDGRFGLVVQNRAGRGGHATVARAHCVYQGQPRPVTYVGGDPARSGLYEWRQGEAPVRMAPTAEAVCFLTGISGKFTGFDESVEITQSGGDWYLFGASGHADVRASARCVLRQQPGRGFAASAPSGRCLDVPGMGNAATGVPLQIWHCESMEVVTDQRWELNAEGFLFNPTLSMCAGAEGASGMTNRTPVVMENCEFGVAESDQRWELVPGGYFRHLLSGKCMDVDGAPGFHEGARIQLYDCEIGAPGTDQRWFYR
jgi:hypothetical protein